MSHKLNKIKNIEIVSMIKQMCFKCCSKRETKAKEVKVWLLKTGDCYAVEGFRKTVNPCHFFVI